MVDVRFHMVVIDRGDPRSLAAFWESFTGYERRSDHEDRVPIYAPDGSMQRREAGPSGRDARPLRPSAGRYRTSAA
jgi:hypothetical protein